MKTTSDAARSVDALCERILAGQPLDAETDLRIDEFAALYHRISAQVGVLARVDIVLQNDRAIVQFTSIQPGHRRVYVVSDRRLRQQDFSRIVSNAVFHGDLLQVSVQQRLREERANILVSMGLGILLSVVLFLLGNSAAPNYVDYLGDPDGFVNVGRVVDCMVRINEMLLTSATLFLSVFLVFTVSQTSKLQEDVKLFDSGLLHKFERDDRLVAVAALTGLLLSVLNVAVLALPVALPIALWRIGRMTVTLNKLSLVSPLMTGLAIAFLVFCFLALLYYLKRMMLITNRTMSSRVLAIALRSVKERRSPGNGDGSSRS